MQSNKKKPNQTDELGVFINMRNVNGNKKGIPNTAQNIYLNQIQEQIGGVSKSKQSKKYIKPTDDDEESLSNSDSESNTESGSRSETETETETDIEVENQEDEEKNEESEDDTEAQEENDEAKEDDEDEKDEEESEGVVDTEYNEDGPTEKETEGNAEDEDCLYQYDDLVDEKDSEHIPKQIPDDQRMTDKQMTHYEKIRILGIRSKQISMGAKVMIKYNGNLEAIELAKYELDNKTTPLIIKRPLPDNTYELWKVSDLSMGEDDMSEITKRLNITFDSSVIKFNLL